MIIILCGARVIVRPPVSDLSILYSVLRSPVGVAKSGALEEFPWNCKQCKHLKSGKFHPHTEDIVPCSYVDPWGFLNIGLDSVFQTP